MSEDFEKHDFKSRCPTWDIDQQSLKQADEMLRRQHQEIERLHRRELRDQIIIVVLSAVIGFLLVAIVRAVA
jgi:hypothetical protein